MFFRRKKTDRGKFDPFSHLVESAEFTGLYERNSLSSFLTYGDYDRKHHLMYLRTPGQVRVGFTLNLYPLLVAGIDAETQIETLINSCPADTVLQFGVFASPNIGSFIRTWCDARTQKAGSDLLRIIAERRRDFYLSTRTDRNMLENAVFHPRDLRYYLHVSIPFSGNLKDSKAIRVWRESVVDLRNSMIGALDGAGIGSEVADTISLRLLLRELLNPHIHPDRVAVNTIDDVPANEDLIEPNACYRVSRDGTIRVSSRPTATEDEDDFKITCLTVDSYPDTPYLPMVASLLGDPASREDRIMSPFWLYTTIHVLNQDKFQDAITAKLGLINKQTMSESEWYKSMMGHLFTRRDHINDLLRLTRSGHLAVRAYTGINIYSRPDHAKKDAQYVASIWRRAGYRASPEKSVSMPVFLASLPFQYVPGMDPLNKGLQRARTMHSLNAACLVPVQGDWKGHPAEQGGPLLISRRGQVTSFDLFNTDSNYNFVVVATSGAGKSFFANEIVTDFLSKGGMIRIIDVGRSYYRFCEINNGMNVVFNPDRPQSLNPLYGLKDEKDLREMMPLLKTLLRQMAYPLQPEQETPSWEYSAIEAAVEGAWRKHGEVCGLKHVYEWLIEHSDDRAKDLAFQLAPFAVGRYAAWFNGPKELELDNPFVVVELEELNVDPDLKTVVLTLMIHQVTREMYLSSREIPKLLAIDEAWDLLGDVKTGKFIETAFRRIRKYKGSAGVITQSFADLEKSDASRAAIENASWQFLLYQKAESLEVAKKNGRIVADKYIHDLLRSVKPGPGFSEVYIRSERGEGVYRFITDRHSYWTFTSNARDINRIDALVAEGKTLVEAIDQLATEDYRRIWGVTLEEALKQEMASFAL